MIGGDAILYSPDFLSSMGRCAAALRDDDFWGCCVGADRVGSVGVRLARLGCRGEHHGVAAVDSTSCYGNYWIGCGPSWHGVAVGINATGDGVAGGGAAVGKRD